MTNSSIEAASFVNHAIEGRYLDHLERFGLEQVIDELDDDRAVSEVFNSIRPESCERGPACIARFIFTSGGTGEVDRSEAIAMCGHYIGDVDDLAGVLENCDGATKEMTDLLVERLGDFATGDVKIVEGMFLSPED